MKLWDDKMNILNLLVPRVLIDDDESAVLNSHWLSFSEVFWVETIWVSSKDHIATVAHLETGSVYFFASQITIIYIRYVIAENLQRNVRPFKEMLPPILSL